MKALILLALVVLLFVMCGCGGSSTTNVEPPCSVGSKEQTFTFDGNGSQIIEAPLLRASNAGAWSLRLSLSMTSPAEMPAGDNVAVFFVLTSPTIQSREFLDNAAFAPVPFSDGGIRDVAELVVAIPAAEDLEVSTRTQYNNAHGATSIGVRVAAEACAER